MFSSSRFPALALAAGVVLLTGCSGPEPSPAAVAPPVAGDATVPAAEAAETREVALFSLLPIRADAEAGFLPVMLDNARLSRREPGAISFDVFRSETGGGTLFLFERWEDAGAVERHNATPNLKAVAQALPQVLDGDAISYTLTELPPYGAGQRRAPVDPAISRNVIVLLQVLPERERTFIDAIAAVTPHARSAPGNAAFELYRVEDLPQHYVLFERWDSVADHEAHLAQPYSADLDAVIPGTLASPIDQRNRFLVTDIVP